MKYTVLLLYPEQMTDGHVETTQQWVKAKNVVKAICKARRLVLEDLNNSDVDLKVLAVYEGHLNDVSGRGEQWADLGIAIEIPY